MIDYYREFEMEDDASSYARSLIGYLTIVVFQSKRSGKWIVTAS